MQCNKGATCLVVAHPPPSLSFYHNLFTALPHWRASPPPPRLIPPLPNLTPPSFPPQGLTLYKQLVSGQPAWLSNALEDQLGGRLMAVPQLLLLLLAAPLALWHLRTWWAANSEVVR